MLSLYDRYLEQQKLISNPPKTKTNFFMVWECYSVYTPAPLGKYFLSRYVNVPIDQFLNIVVPAPDNDNIMILKMTGGREIAVIKKTGEAIAKHIQTGEGFDDYYPDRPLDTAKFLI